MECAETPGNPGKTLGNQEITQEDVPGLLAVLAGQADHHDQMIHDVHRMVSEMHAVFTEHLPAIRSAAALADPGAAVRAYLHLPARKPKGAPR